MRFLSAIATAAAVTFACPVLAHDGVEITDAYARFMPGAKAGAAFMTIDNHAGADDRLVGAASDAAMKVELHTHKTDANGVMQMLPVEGGIVIPANGSAVLQRGGDHVMFMGLTSAIANGDHVTLMLTFEKAGDITLTVPVDNAR
jgi:copper(I)-binding protein